MWGGKLTFPTPMFFTLGAISVFLIGGLSGPILATVTTDLNLHDTYFVVGHFHATIFGGFVFPFLAAIYFWYPKITGRMYNETMGKIHFWIMTPAFWVMSLGQMSVGVMGMRRRIANYDPNLGDGPARSSPSRCSSPFSAFAIAFGILLMLYNLLHSAEVGRAGRQQSVALTFTRMADSFAAAGAQLRPPDLQWSANPTTTVWPVRPMWQWPLQRAMTSRRCQADDSLPTVAANPG